MTLAPPPERELFEREIHDLISGDISNVARLLQFDLSTVSRAFNPFKPERHNPIYLFTIYLWAFDYLRDGMADVVLSIVLRERAKWKGSTPKRRTSGPKLTGQIGREWIEACEKEWEGEPLDVQIKEFYDVKKAVDEKIDDLIEQRNALLAGNGVAADRVRNGADIVTREI
jgi:hypothetical protein